MIVFKFVKSGVAIAVFGFGALDEGEKRINHLASELLTKRIAGDFDVVEETGLEAGGASVDGVSSGLCGQDATIEIGGKEPALRSDGDGIGDERGHIHGSESSGLAGERNNFVFVETAANGEEIFPEEFLDGIVGGGAIRCGGLSGERGESREAGFGTGIYVDAVDGETETLRNLVIEAPGSESDVVIGNGQDVHGLSLLGGHIRETASLIDINCKCVK